MDAMGIVFAISGGAFVLGLVVSMIVKCCHRCGPDQIMVIYGNGTTKFMHSGFAFVLPGIQRVRFLRTTSFPLSVYLPDAHSADGFDVCFWGLFTIRISSDDRLLKNASERLLGMNYVELVQFALDVIKEHVRMVISCMDLKEMLMQRDKLLIEIREDVETELSKVGFELIDVSIDIRDEAGGLDALSQESSVEELAQKATEVATERINNAKARVKALQALLEEERDSSAEVRQKKLKDLIAQFDKQDESSEGRIDV